MSNLFAPLTTAEIEEAVHIFRDQHGDERAVFCSSGLSEPAKADVKSGGAIDRVVKFLGTDSAADGGFEAYINVSQKKVDRILRLPNEALWLSRPWHCHTAD